jgi:hypothetical protein
MPLPKLLSDGHRDCCARDSVLLVVYAPFGTDATLSTFPDGSSQDVIQHPLVQSLLKVAASGVHVMALIDRFADDTYLVQIPAGKPTEIHVTSRWKHDMSSPNNLRGFLQHAARMHPSCSIVLALEGHGAGFLPNLDSSQLTPQKMTENGAFLWRIEATKLVPVRANGSPVLPGGFPGLPGGFPGLPANHMPMTTFGLGAALKAAIEAGVPKLSVIHFNNCFNMSVELLHTVAPYAEFATGYINYNFFTAGVSYPAVFEKLKNQGTATAKELASWFAQENGAFLAAKRHHPTVGCSVELKRMQQIVDRVDGLSDALLAALRVPSEAQRDGFVDSIKLAIIRAQQLDTSGNMELETPDQMTDLLSLAHELQAENFGPFKVVDMAAALEESLDLDLNRQPAPIKQYGARDQPWTLPPALWDFSSSRLAMSIFLPDPLNEGLWDWRSPYYMSVNPTPVQPNIIDFLQVTNWVDFLIEYHRKAPFVGILPAVIPEYPVFNKDSDKLEYPDPSYPCRPGKTPRGLKGK